MEKKEYFVTSDDDKFIFGHCLDGCYLSNDALIFKTKQPMYKWYFLPFHDCWIFYRRLRTKKQTTKTTNTKYLFSSIEQNGRFVTDQFFCSCFKQVSELKKK